MLRLCGGSLGACQSSSPRPSSSSPGVCLSVRPLSNLQGFHGRWAITSIVPRHSSEPGTRIPHSRMDLAYAVHYSEFGRLIFWQPTQFPKGERQAASARLGLNANRRRIFSLTRRVVKSIERSISTGENGGRLRLLSTTICML